MNKADNRLFSIQRRYTVISVPTGIVHSFNARGRFKAIAKGIRHFNTAVSIIRIS